MIDWLIDHLFLNIKWIVDGCLQWSRNTLSFQENPSWTQVLSGFCVLQSLVFSTVFCGPLLYVSAFIFYLLVFVLSVTSNYGFWLQYPFGIFQSLWLTQILQNVSCMVIIYTGIYEVQLQIKVQHIISRMACRSKTFGFSAMLTLACYSVDNETR